LAGISSDAFTISLINFWKSFRPGAGMMMEFRLPLLSFLGNSQETSPGVFFQNQEKCLAFN